MVDPSHMLTPTNPAAPGYSIDGAQLREALTAGYEDSSGDTSDLRARAVKILKEAWDLSRAALLGGIDEHKGGHSTAKALAKCADEIVSALWDFTLTHVYRARNPTEGERLALLGLPFDAARADEFVRAELMLNPHGQVLAVRLLD